MTTHERQAISTPPIQKKKENVNTAMVCVRIRASLHSQWINMGDVLCHTKLLFCIYVGMQATTTKTATSLIISIAYFSNVNQQYVFKLNIQAVYSFSTNVTMTESCPKSSKNQSMDKSRGLIIFSHEHTFHWILRVKVSIKVHFTLRMWSLELYSFRIMEWFRWFLLKWSWCSKCFPKFIEFKRYVTACLDQKSGS